jgi:hypothetical protein
MIFRLWFKRLMINWISLKMISWACMWQGHKPRGVSHSYQAAVDGLGGSSIECEQTGEGLVAGLGPPLHLRAGVQGSQGGLCPKHRFLLRFVSPWFLRMSSLVMVFFVAWSTASLNPVPLLRASQRTLPAREVINLGDEVSEQNLEVLVAAQIRAWHQLCKPLATWWYQLPFPNWSLYKVRRNYVHKISKMKVYSCTNLARGTTTNNGEWCKNCLNWMVDSLRIESDGVVSGSKILIQFS